MEYLDPNLTKSNWIDKEFIKYHEGQWENPKRSTAALLKFIEIELSKSREVIDLACGAGAATAQIANEFPQCNFAGIDHSEVLIEKANEQVKNRRLTNLEFIHGDVLNLHQPKDQVDGVICIQTVSWLDDFKPLLSEIATKIRPTWIAITGLFYPGNITAKIRILEHERETNTYFNVYAIPEMAKFIQDFGYEIQSYQPFEIDSDLPKPNSINVMQTYTERIESEQGWKRIQISGPILINSGFLKFILRA